MWGHAGVCSLPQLGPLPDQRASRNLLVEPDPRQPAEARSCANLCSPCRWWPVPSQKWLHRLQPIPMRWCELTCTWLALGPLQDSRPHAPRYVQSAAESFSCSRTQGRGPDGSDQCWPMPSCTEASRSAVPTRQAPGSFVRFSNAATLLVWHHDAIAMTVTPGRCQAWTLPASCNQIQMLGWA